ncbi:hypothetical protein EDB92DRAFT_2002675 [Lactarius akahatsu]|uniref:Uncharacterized protein n=1 Tax=Lactarius akahatsu TaxID=416441 RepID=A0AAD4LFT4_9AGAM|nr:hypothetical protein EDB92DRAFT_2002675 [Lactarius akahatsu]
MSYSGNNTKSPHLSVGASLKSCGQPQAISTFRTCTSGTRPPPSKRSSIRSHSRPGISDSLTWVVSKANQYAKDHDKAPFSVYQGNWTSSLWPALRVSHLLIGVLGAGKIAEEPAAGRKVARYLAPIGSAHIEQIKVYDGVEEIGKEKEQLMENIAALDIPLTAEQIRRIEASPFDPGFAHVMIGNGTTDSGYAQSAGYSDRVPFPQPITPMKYWKGRE